MTNDAPAADRLAARLDELEVAAFDCGRLGNSSATLRRKEAARKAVEIVVRLAASGEPPREPSEPVTTAAYDGYKGNLTPLSDIAAMAVDLGPPNLSSTFRGAAPRAPHAPDLEAARAIAANYEKAPCFSALLGELDPDSPCTCPTCGHRAILLALGVASGGAPQP